MRALAFVKVVSLFVVCLLVAACGGGGGGGSGSNGTTTTTSVIYVSDTSGSDANNGLSPTAAKQSLGAAIAAASGLSEIHVAAGTYNISSALTLGANISLLGGYAADFATRDPASNVTTIMNTTASPAVNSVFVVNDANISSANTIDGFILNAGNSSIQSIAIEILNGSPTISNNTIIGGQGNDRMGIRIHGGSAHIKHNVIQNCRICISIGQDAASLVISNNTITADADIYTYAINASSITNPSTSLLIEGNTIYGGDAAGTYNSANGIYTAANTATIRNNKIDAGSVNDSVNGATYGIRIMGGSVTIINNDIYGGDGGGVSEAIESNFTAAIFNNTIDGGSGVTSSAVYNAAVTAATTLRNNIIMTTAGTNQYCVYDSVTAPLEVRNNDLFNCSTAVYYDSSAGCTGNADGDNNAKTCTLAEMESLASITNGASGNVSVDPMFANISGASNNSKNFSDNDWHLSNTTPAEVFEGGLDLSADFTDDFDAVTRTAVVNNAPANANAAGWSMGAYEYNP